MFFHFLQRFAKADPEQQEIRSERRNAVFVQNETNGDIS